MKDKVVIVTGGAVGIGGAIVEKFADRGANVVIADIKAEQGERLIDTLKKKGSEAEFIWTDVSDRSEVENLMEKTVERFGRLDYAVNNAGIEGDQADTAACTEANWDRVLEINLKGVWLCMKYEIRKMLQTGGGAIVNISSVAGLVGFRNLPAYTSSKHAIIGLTRTTALEFAQKNIRINAVCPGVIQTEMIDRVTGNDPEKRKQYESMEPIGRMGRPEEVAAAVVWLCSDEASFVTGQAVPVDGAFTSE